MTWGAIPNLACPLTILRAVCVFSLRLVQLLSPSPLTDRLKVFEYLSPYLDIFAHRKGQVYWTPLYTPIQILSALPIFSFSHFCVDSNKVDLNLIRFQLNSLRSNPIYCPMIRKLLCVISVLWNFWRLVLWPGIWSILVKIPCALAKNVYSAFIREYVLCMLMRSILLNSLLLLHVSAAHGLLTWLQIFLFLLLIFVLYIFKLCY